MLHYFANEMARPYAGARRHSDYHVGILSPAIMNFCQIIYYLIKPYCYKICKLHFHYRF